MDRLLLSCPNRGGVVLVDEGGVRVLDRVDTTGLFLGDQNLARANQKGGVHWHNRGRSRVIPFDPQADLHDVLVFRDALYAVRTGSNQVVADNGRNGGRHCWSFPGQGDAWHLNCLGLLEDRLLVSAFGKFADHRGYKDRTQGAGLVMDLFSGEVLLSGLSQPHSLVGQGHQLWLCNSQAQELLLFGDFRLLARVKLFGYPRGLACSGRYIYVGISNTRNAEGQTGPLDGLHARIAVLRRQDLALVGTLEIPFPEIYAIALWPQEGAASQGLAPKEIKSRLVSSSRLGAAH